jgi:subtilisin family serine protease
MTLSTAIGFALAGAGLHGSTNAVAGTYAPPPATNLEAADADGVYIITYTEAGLLNYEGGVAGIARTAPSAAGQKLDRTTIAAHSYEAWLEAQREVHRAAIESRLGRVLEVTHSYGITFNGIATQLTADEAAKIAGLPGVASVRPAGIYHLDTYRGPAFIGADKIWNGSSTPGGVGTKGQGVKVGVIDGGANSAHPSFANDPTCGFSAGLPKLTARDCSSSSGGICNGSNPEANPTYGHGVHTASTVAGNTIDNTASPPPSLPNGVTMSGVAPCAQVFQYKVCATNSCAGADILAGIQNAIADQVDAINFSISGGTSPWSDNDRQFLDAVGAGVFVAASAGNTSTTITNPVGQVNHRGPWVMTVAASTHDRKIGPGMSLTGPGTPPAATQNIPLNPGSTTPAASTPTFSGKPVKTYPTNIEACTASGGIPAGTFTGAVAVVRRGTCPFTEKITNAFNAGAEMVVVGNNQVGSINMDTTGAPSVPAFSMDQVSGDAVIAFVAGNPSNTTTDVNPITNGTRQGDVLADFSFRGPTPSPLADLTKPDITAPGVDIYAATDPGSGQYQFMSGTSMSGPHVAGSGALMKAVHPNWTPMEIRSALMMTAKRDGFQENGTTPWNIDDVGSGRVDVAKAAMAGLTMDETKANFLAANPSGGTINVKELNVASLRNMACTGACSWTRKVKNRLAVTGSWSIAATTDPSFTVTATPSTFNLAPGAEQTITFTATPTQNITAVKFGYITLTEAGSASPQQHITVALKGTSATTYTVGGTVSGLTGTGLVLKLNGGSDLSVSANGAFTFAGGLTTGTAYAVTVGTQPTGQVCTVANGTGTIASANVTNVAVTCAVAATYTVGGTVGGLTGTGLKLKLNGGSDLSISANGAFTFPGGLTTGTAYAVTVGTQPSGQTCTVANGSGTIGSANVTNVTVTCSSASTTYTVGGRVRGMTGSGLVLQLNGSTTLPMSANGLFVFTGGLPDGTAYAVTVATQPTSTPPQACTVANGSGTIAGANVTNVEVTCANTITDRIFQDGFEGSGGPAAAFSENFDAYAAGGNVHGQGGWKGWGNDPAAGATVVTAQSASAPNSIEIKGASDLIHEFSQLTSGSWTITAKQYIPSTFTGQSYFIFENVYSDTDMSVISWSMQVVFDGATNQLGNESGAASPFTASLVKGRWVDLKLVVDLDNDVQTFWYDGVQMYSGSWTNQFPGQDVPGSRAIGSIDLFANGASAVYYDDIKIVPTTP